MENESHFQCYSPIGTRGGILSANSRRCFWLLALMVLLPGMPQLLSGENATNVMTATIRSRKADPSTGLVAALETKQDWPASKTAIIVCDMWDRHWCRGASARVAEMGPVMNKTLKAARQTPLLEIHPEDAISDQGPEIFALLDQKGIDHVILMGVHINMCVLGRPFGIRQMVGQRKN